MLVIIGVQWWWWPVSLGESTSLSISCFGRSQQSSPAFNAMETKHRWLMTQWIENERVSNPRNSKRKWKCSNRLISVRMHNWIATHKWKRTHSKEKRTTIIYFVQVSWSERFWHTFTKITAQRRVFFSLRSGANEFKANPNGFYRFMALYSSFDSSFFCYLSMQIFGSLPFTIISIHRTLDAILRQMQQCSLQ